AIARYKAAGDTPEAKDGLGLAQLDSASLASATGPRALVEKSKLASTPAADKRALLLKAAEGNKRWAEPHILLAANESEPLRKLPHMKKVAELQPRNAKNWENLALLQEQVNQFTDAGKSWSAALRASVDDGEQARIQAAKARSEELRVAQQIAEKQAAKRKEEEELNAVRNKALAQIRAAEAKVNAGNQPVDKSKPLDWYQEEKPPARVTGNLFRVDCTGKAAKLHLRTAEETDVALLVVDPSKIVISGGGEKMFACGIQKPARTIVVLHNGKEGKKTGTTGEVLSIEIH
ncbi:MAG TPA: hypothetical protein VE621_06270, partial [Bryobacteraceae bacterium]|nr:hypothetical protein [Bryobacteraceae bacterium]